MLLSHADLIIFGKVLLAGFLAYLVGWERERHGHEAGIRTLALLAIGSTILTAFALDTFPASADRIISTITTGIGFLGAGMILRAQAGKVRGLTTAASAWVMTSISILIGGGHYGLSILLTAIVLFLLWLQFIPWLKVLIPPESPLAIPPTPTTDNSQSTSAIAENQTNAMTLPETTSDSLV